MPQDFSGQNLRGRSFKGQDLTGADFSNAVIRGADFSKAILRDANFSNTKAGLQSYWAIVLVIASLILAALSGFIASWAGIFVGHTLPEGNCFYILARRVTIVIVLVVFLFVTWHYQDLGAGFISIALVTVLAAALAAALAVVLSIIAHGTEVLTGALSGNGFFGGTLGGAGAWAGTLAGTLAVALTIAATLVVAGEVVGFIGLALALIGAVVGVTTNGIVILEVAMAWAGATTLLGNYVAQSTLAGNEQFALIRKIAIAFATTGGTSFRVADLTNANFTRATLKNTDFRKAILTRTCWHKAKILDLVRPGETYLQNAQLRQVLVTGQGQDRKFDRLDLRGVNLQGANLANASFIGADLSAASLQDADLSRAKLVQTQLDETDLTGATLTGAYIEDWGITSHTKLQGVKCEYVFMRVPTKDDPNPRRKPDNWEEKFEDTDFADFIQPLFDTLDLYHTQGISPRAIAISFKELAENHPDAELEIVAMERRGKNFLLRVKTAAGVNLSTLSAEYFSTYNQIKSLVEQEVQKLSGKLNIDNRIISVENAVQTALQRPNYYSVTRIQRIDMHNNPGGFSVSGSIDGNVNNLQGDNNRTVQGNNNQAVVGDRNQVSQQSQVGNDTEAPLTKDDVINLLAELETLIRGAELPSDTKEEAIEDLSAAKKATDKEEPNKTRALDRLDSVAETLEKTSKTVDSGQKLWSTAKPIIVKVAGWLGAAAGSHLLGL